MKTLSPKALIGRINRRLAHEHEALRTSRGTRAEQELGRHYVLDLDRNAILARDIDLESYGRELGVLSEGVQVAA